jgi:chromosome segregation ATPase
MAVAEDEREHYMNEAQALAKRVDELLEDVRDADGVVYTFRKELSEVEARLRQQQNMYQAARNDRSALNR